MRNRPRCAVLAAAAFLAAGCATPAVVKRARSGDEAALRSALQKSPRPEHLDQALCEAAARGHAGIARLLIEKGAHVEGVNIRKRRGCWGHPKICTKAKGPKPPRKIRTSLGQAHPGSPAPVGCAAFYGHPELVDILLAAGASPNIEPFHLSFQRGLNVPVASPLVLAAVQGDARSVKRLLEARADPFYASAAQTFMAKEYTAYEWAVDRGNQEAAALLKAAMEARAPGSAAAAKGSAAGTLGFLKQVTSLAGAFVPGMSQVSDALGKIETAATVAQVGSTVYQASRSAPALAHPAAAAELPLPPAPEPKLHEAAHAGEAGKIAMALAGGANVDEICAEGATALMHAAAMGHHEAVEALARAGANVDAANAEGVTALMAAAVTARREAVEALLAARADPNLKAKSGGTALSLAEAAGHKDIAAALRKAGAR